ncbi:MAG TPA: hypothetical protein VGQ84_07685 [Gaiellaceae bacterium]|jgi:hypothetical protein|nr:hypothetical protein [Gaiellaceae bacterium]
MKRRRFAFAAAFTIAIAAIAVTNGGAGNEPGFDTARPAQLVPEPGSGTIVDPILSTGDIVGTYQMSGVPDGLGAYKDNHNNVVVLMNHELGRTFPALPPGVDARISKVVINGQNRDVQEAHYAFTGAEGFERFCSSTLEVIEGTPWYFTGEEAIGVSPLVGHDGSSIVMNAETGVPQETPHFGHMNHENVVPVERIRKFMLVTTDDDFRIGQPAYLFAYIADSLEAAVSGDPSRGSLYVWRSKNPAFVDLVKSQTIAGEFVPISQAENSDSTELKAAATARRAFRFARLEDIAAAQQHPGRLYFTDTGKAGENNVNGALYRLDINPSEPTEASVTLLLDSDAGDNLRRPDNLDTSAHSVVIQEDGGQNRVLVYDIDTGTVRVVARTPNLAWESSGAINAQTLLGHDWWLMDVQAHPPAIPPPVGFPLAPQPGAVYGPDGQPVPNTGFGEDGQLMAVYIPDST